MKLSLGAVLLLYASVVTSTHAFASDWCDVSKGASVMAGLLTIGEYGAFSSDAYCPDLNQKLGDTFTYPNRGLNIILRFEGNADYLASSKARKPITASLRKSNTNRTVSGFLTIADDYIDIRKARDETELKGGYFDWRFRVAFKTIIRPGVYTLTLRQGGEAICLANGACQIVVDIKPSSSR